MGFAHLGPFVQREGILVDNVKFSTLSTEFSTGCLLIVDSLFGTFAEFSAFVTFAEIDKKWK